MVKRMKAVRFRFVSKKSFRWIGIYVFRTFTIPPIRLWLFPKRFYGRTLLKYMANSFTGSITLFAFWRRFNFRFPKGLRILWMSLNWKLLSFIRRFLSTDTTKALVHAFVTSRVDYCNSLLYGLPASHLNKVQRVLNAAARLVCRAPRYCRITPLLYELHWLPVRQRISFKIHVMRAWWKARNIRIKLLLSLLLTLFILK